VLERHVPSLTAAAIAWLATVVIVYAGLKSAEAVFGADMPSALKAALPKIGLFRRLVVGAAVGSIVAAAVARAAKRDPAKALAVLRYVLVAAACSAVLQALFVP
jgi:hypothetical protein